ncbi:hypothetical protein ACFL5V_10065 [Fibrobacterota bacterium]
MGNISKLERSEERGDWTLRARHWELVGKSMRTSGIDMASKILRWE